MSLPTDFIYRQIYWLKERHGSKYGQCLHFCDYVAASIPVGFHCLIFESSAILFYEFAVYLRTISLLSSNSAKSAKLPEKRKKTKLILSLPFTYQQLKFS